MALNRSLCTNYLANGKTEVKVEEFENWASVKEDSGMLFDWDDLEGNSKRRMAGLKREEERKAEMKRLKMESRERKRKESGKKY